MIHFMNSSVDSWEISTREFKVEPPMCLCVFFQPCLQAQKRLKIDFKHGFVCLFVCFPHERVGGRKVDSLCRGLIIMIGCGFLCE